jgi:hypothetical protein
MRVRTIEALTRVHGSDFLLITKNSTELKFPGILFRVTGVSCGTTSSPECSMLHKDKDGGMAEV